MFYFNQENLSVSILFKMIEFIGHDAVKYVFF